MSKNRKVLDLVQSRRDVCNWRDQIQDLDLVLDYKEDVQYRVLFAIHLADLYWARDSIPGAIASAYSYKEENPEFSMGLFRLLREEYPLAIPNYNGKPVGKIIWGDQQFFGLFEEPESQWEGMMAHDSYGNWRGVEPHL